VTDEAEVTEPREVAVVSASALGEITRAEIDTQIATAKRFPRSVGKALTAATTLATMNQEVAASCMYAVKRGDKMITGPSVRLAEIVASTWGNLRFGSRVVGDDGRFLTVQGFAHDLESNTAFAFELKIRVTYKNGGRYSDDMIAVTSNAGASKALRNAVFRVVPRSLVDQIQAAAKKVAVGDAKTLAVRRDAAVAHFNKLGVATEKILALFGKPTVADLDADDLFHLHGIATAIKEGDTKVDEAFPEGDKPSRTAETAKKLPAVEGPKEDAKPAAGDGAKAGAGGLYGTGGPVENLR
jgi:hypothetical protein